MTRITATQASRNFSDILNRAQYNGESFEVTRGNEVIARIAPAKPKSMTLGELLDAIDNSPGLDPDDARRFEKEIEDLRKEMVLPESQWD